MKISDERYKYLKLLAKQYSTIRQASKEIINLEAIRTLPKGTEHFLSDIHGEDEAFLHILKNGSGVIWKKIGEALEGRITEAEKRELATLIYYPEEILLRGKEDDIWYYKVLERLVLVCRSVASKYTRSKVRKALPEDFAYILEELLHEQEAEENKQVYYDQILSSIIEIDQKNNFIIAICQLIQRFAIDHLHIIGDVYDRGAGPHIIMDKLMSYHSVDFQWGNHDIVWMGASAGSLLCIAHVVRISLRYGNHELLEESYGINMVPLAKFAMETYPEVETVFKPKGLSEFDKNDEGMIAQMHKAIAMIMFKLEGQFVQRNPEYKMEDRRILEAIDYQKNTLEVEGQVYALNWLGGTTINLDDPYQLTATEMEIMLKLKASFLTNEKLKQHMNFLLKKGSIYLVHNDNLLYHGCIPTNEDGSFTEVSFEGVKYKGKGLLDYYDQKVRQIYGRRLNLIGEKDLDLFTYLWSGADSSLYGKHAMKVFERYFIEDEASHIERQNPYYGYNLTPEYCNQVFREFEMDENISRIINGHVPVKVKKGEMPVKAEGKMIVIDGGLSKAYQKVTGIAGYTLIYNSHGILIAQHEAFVTKREAIDQGIDLSSKLNIVYNPHKRIRVAQTDIGKQLLEMVVDLRDLVTLYREGLL